MNRRTLTPEEIADQRRGSTRIAPGIWVDRDGGLHVSVPELLELFGWDDTPTNRAEVEHIVAEELRRANPDATLVYQD
jgi:hypothetical protein